MSITITAVARTALGHQTKALRRAGSIPAIMYGRKVAARTLAVPGNAFQRVWKQIGESTLVDVIVDNAAPVKALVQDVALDPVTDVPVHIDFHAVAMDEEINARIPLVFAGIAPAVKEYNGVLMKQIDHLEVRALPNNLVPSLTVDLALLVTLEDAIRVKDLALPDGVTASIAPDAIIASVTEMREEVVEAPVAAAAVPAEGTAPAEGAPTAEGAKAPEGKDKEKKDEGKEQGKKDGKKKE